MAEGFEIRSRFSVIRCPYCHEELGDDEYMTCPECDVVQHVACWEELGRCSSCPSVARPLVHVRSRGARRHDRSRRRPARGRTQASGFMGLNSTGVVLFLVLVMVFLPLAFLPWLIPSMREDHEGS